MLNILSTYSSDMIDIYLKGDLTIAFLSSCPTLAKLFPLKRKFYFYSLQPTYKVVAEAVIKDIVKVSKNKCERYLETDWDMKFFKDHLKYCPNSYLIKLTNVVKLETPLSIEDFGIKCVPLLWCYV